MPTDALDIPRVQDVTRHRRPVPRTSSSYRPAPTSAATTASMRSNRPTGTRPEVTLRSMLHRAGRRFRKDLLIRLPGVAVRADIVFPRAKVAVFVDGCFWHCCPEHGSRPRANADYWNPKLDRNVERDRRADAALKVAGWTVVRIWEHVPPMEAAGLVSAALDGDGCSGEGAPE